MATNNILILLDYYVITYGWACIQVICLLVFLFLIRKYKCSVSLLFRIAMAILICVFVLELLDNLELSQKVMEIFFLYIVFIAIYFFFQKVAKKE